MPCTILNGLLRGLLFEGSKRDERTSVGRGNRLDEKKYPLVVGTDQQIQGAFGVLVGGCCWADKLGRKALQRKDGDRFCYFEEVHGR